LVDCFSPIYMKNKTIKKIIVFFLLILSFTISGQNTKIINQAKKLNKAHQYHRSIKLLEQYLQKRKDANTLWLYGETLHSAHKYTKALTAYKQAVKLAPNNSLLKYDYALKSADAGKLNQAINLIKPFAKYKNTYQFVAKKQLAKFYYWQGSYDKATATLQSISKHKKDAEIKQLQSKINQSKSNWIGFDFVGFSDDQPLTSINPKLHSGYYINEAATAGLGFGLSQYSFSDKNLSGLNLHSYLTYNFFAIAAKSKLVLGYNKLPNNETTIEGKFSFIKNIAKNLSAEIAFEYKPYLATTSSLTKKVMQWRNNFSLTWQDPKAMQAKLSFDQYNFPTENNGYYATSIWALSPQYNLNNIAIKVGLGANYSNATNNTFASDNSLEFIQENGLETEHISGHYESFFSPSKQFETSIIITAKTQLNKDTTIGLDTNLGVIGTRKNPYLFINTEDQNDIFIDRGFAKINYFPVNIKASVDYLLNYKTALQGFYRFQSTSYYQNHFAGIKILYKF